MQNKIVTLLNKGLGDELSAIHQYLYFHFHCDDQGLDLLANLFKKTAIDEMKHLEKLSERILFLKGEIEMTPAQEVQKIKTIREMLGLAAKMEQESIKEYNAWAAEAGANSDAISKQLFESLIAEEEKHYDQFDKELTNLANFGTNYLALQSIERSKGIAGK